MEIPIINTGRSAKAEEEILVCVKRVYSYDKDEY